MSKRHLLDLILIVAKVIILILELLITFR